MIIKNNIFLQIARLTLFCLVLQFFNSCTTSDKGYVFKYSNEQPETAIRSQSMLFFKERLEKESDGKIKVDLFFSGVLGNERELMDLVSTGALQGTRGGFFNDVNPKFNLLTLPFLVSNWDEASNLVNSSLMKTITLGLEPMAFMFRQQGYHKDFELIQIIKNQF